jgi:hypothetical protein
MTPMEIMATITITCAVLSTITGMTCGVLLAYIKQLWKQIKK